MKVGACQFTHFLEASLSRSCCRQGVADSSLEASGVVRLHSGRIIEEADLQKRVTALCWVCAWNDSKVGRIGSGGFRELEKLGLLTSPAQYRLGTDSCIFRSVWRCP